MREQKITLGEIRGADVIGLLVYYSDYRYSHHLKISANQSPDDVRLSDLEPRFVCRTCGTHGADIRPNFPPARMGTLTRKPLDLPSGKHEQIHAAHT